MTKTSSNDDPTRALELLERLTLVSDEAQLDRLFERLESVGRPFVLSFVNAHAVNLACRDQAFFDALRASDLLLRDGSGVRIMCGAFGRSPGLNLNGTDLIPRILKRFSGRPLALCGTAEPYLSEAASQLDGVVLKLDGFREMESYADAIKRSGAEIALLAMGMPKQERTAQHVRKTLDQGVVIINGGAILDFMAGRFNRAPRWMRVTGLEWLYRLAMEPRRLWSRYVLGNAVFLARIARLKLSRVEGPRERL